MNGTVSFSELTMPVISRLSVNSSLAIPSKHFFKCGCTRSGSFVSDKISRSSSFDRKKNLVQGKENIVTRSSFDGSHFQQRDAPGRWILPGDYQLHLKVFPRPGSSPPSPIWSMKDHFDSESKRKNRSRHVWAHHCGDWNDRLVFSTACTSGSPGELLRIPVLRSKYPESPIYLMSEKVWGNL